MLRHFHVMQKMGEIFAGKGRGSNDTILGREQSISRHFHVMQKMGEFLREKDWVQMTLH